MENYIIVFCSYEIIEKNGKFLLSIIKFLLLICNYVIIRKEINRDRDLNYWFYEIKEEILFVIFVFYFVDRRNLYFYLRLLIINVC